MYGDGEGMRTMRCRSVSIVAALLLTASIAAASEITRATVLAEMNAQRAAGGLPPLRDDARLVAAAGDRMRDMEELAYWSHESPDGRPPFVWMRPRGYDYGFAAENLAVGFETAELLVTGWMESKGHRANILSPVYQDCGIAILEGSTRGRATGMSVVVLFARPRMAEPQAASR
jgi:uncharacterized protein YkwD